MLSISGKFLRRRNKPTAFYYQDVWWRLKHKFWIGVKRTGVLLSYFIAFVSFFLLLLITTHSFTPAPSVFINTKKSQFINNFSVTKGLNHTKVVTFPSLKKDTNSTALVASTPVKTAPSTLRFLERDTNQTLLLYNPPPIPKWTKTSGKIITFMHIGKNAGTSFRSALLRAMSGVGSRCNCPGHQHFGLLDKPQNALVTILRHPIERTLSHFWFTQTLSWGEKAKVDLFSVEQWLDYEKFPLLFSRTRTIWRDGQSAALWFSGLHTAGWAGATRESDQEKDRLEKLAFNQTYLLSKAIENFHRFVYVGLLSDLESSSQLFAFQIEGASLQMPHSNKNRRPRSLEEDIGRKRAAVVYRKLEKLLPVDMAFYKYAKAIIEHRFATMRSQKGGETSLDLRLPLPSLGPGCASVKQEGVIHLKCDPEASLTDYVFLKLSRQETNREEQKELSSAALRS